MAELPLKEYEVKFERTDHGYVRVLAKRSKEAAKFAAQIIEDNELGSLCVQCCGHNVDSVDIREDEWEEVDVVEVTDPTEQQLIERSDLEPPEDLEDGADDVESEE